MVNPIQNNRTSAAGHNHETGVPREGVTGLPTTEAVEGIANSFPRCILDEILMAMMHVPNQTPRLMKVLHSVFANRGHGLAKLYNAFEWNDPECLPSADQLEGDLINLCDINNVSNRDFLIEAIDNLCDQFLGDLIESRVIDEHHIEEDFNPYLFDGPLDDATLFNPNLGAAYQTYHYEHRLDFDEISPETIDQVVTNSAVLVNALFNPLRNSSVSFGFSNLNSATTEKLKQLYAHALTLNENPPLHVKHASALIKVGLNHSDFQTLDDDCKDNFEFLVRAVAIQPSIFQYLSDSVKNNKVIKSLVASAEYQLEITPDTGIL